ncbi:ribosomal protein L11 methyltransferase [Lapidilactobacillus concavus DSM 17758]|uniref:Ribosomal protein L11 methyltransferase n=1 Tax=Lapidilactobacillus concavus DSM 17758 TaxID=1423735 RepID=A0A0R1W2Q1_9LACO|nr:50S ribosomal protein L11 methyltransferase [Lapidilactobacillus concavus]KRM09683.1 ribosomal protein L11 methyltransferase [Lapidilactobacillus concavus DSM 17758]GEL14054.1 ribosomal protein L11 methyltransferase [Lapidilactobacillus concavus]
MEWLQLKLIVDAGDVEIIANVFDDLESGGVQISDDPQYDSEIKKGQVAVSAFLTADRNQSEMVAQLHRRLSQLEAASLLQQTPRLLTREVSESNWTTTWRDYYQPIQLTRFLTVVPKGTVYEPTSTAERLIALEPGKSFGTGMHPTTQLAVSMLELTMHGQETVFDVGTGSGILSIAATFLGAQKVVATELDSVALEFTQHNFELNQITNQVELVQGSLLDQVSQKADLILANMLPEALVPLLPQLATHLFPDGQVIMTGIIQAQAAKMRGLIESAGFTIDLVLQSSDWVCYRFKQHAEA